MKSIRFVTFVLTALVLVASAELLCGDFEREKWERFAPINIDKPPVEEKGLVEVSLSPEVLDAARASLSDIRILDQDGKEVACVVTTTQTRRVTPPWSAASLINRTYVPGKSSSVTADFGDNFLKRIVRVRTKGSDFRREVLIESSNDQRKWQRVREGALLFRVNRKGRVEFNRDTVAVPPNDHRTLRVTVFNAPGERKRIAIEAVETRRTHEDPDHTAPVPLGTGVVTEREKKHQTVIEFDLGFRNLPLAEVSFDFKERNFFRRASLQGRDEKTTVIRYRREDNSPAEKTVDAPWHSVKSFVLFRYTAGAGKTDAALSIPLKGTGYRYLRLVICNEDNPPLTFIGADAKRFLKLVRLGYAPEQTCRLFFGNASASKPSYDLPHYITRLKSEGTLQASLGDVAANPAYSEKVRTLPWSERHRIILWIALVGVGLVLAWLISRQARSLKGIQEESQTPREE